MVKAEQKKEKQSEKRKFGHDHFFIMTTNDCHFERVSAFE